MSFESDITTKYESIFAGRMYWDTAPDAMTTAERQNPFCIVQQVGGEERIYVDMTSCDMLNARLQFMVWGARRMAVADAVRTLRKAILDSNTQTWVAQPLGAMAGEYNDVLKLRGARQDFDFWYPDPLAV